MFENYNDTCTTTIVLNSALDEELNLFKINVEEEEKSKKRDFKCSLNEFPDLYASEAFLTSLKNDNFIKRAEPGYHYFKRTFEDMERFLPNSSIANFDRPDILINLDRNKMPLLELEDSQYECNLTRTGGSRTKIPKLFNAPLGRPNLQGKLDGKENNDYGFITTNHCPKDSKKHRPKKQVLEKRPNGIKQKQLVQCNCKKSKCLRLYCECFAKGLICGVDCNCSDCHNSTELEDLRGLIVQETLEKNPFAFKPKYKKLNTDQQKMLHSRGCNCSKTGCVKKYCECYNAGTGCSRLCRCTNCKNDNIEINDDEVKVYYDRVLRKRRKRTQTDECFDKKIEIIKKLKQSS